MSKTKSVGLYGRDWPSRPDPQREMWVYDAALSVLLFQVIRTVEDMPAQGRPDWWAGCEKKLRVQSAISDFAFDLHLGLNDAQREQLARLLEDAAEALLRRQTITPEEAAGWRVLDDLPVIFRGSEPQDTQPIAELGRTLAGLIRGSLPPPPPQTLWYYGAPGGRTTIGMRQPGTDDQPGPPNDALADAEEFPFPEGTDPQTVIDDLIVRNQKISAIKAIRAAYELSWRQSLRRMMARYDRLRAEQPHRFTLSRAEWERGF